MYADIEKAEQVHSGLVRFDYVVDQTTPGRDGTTLSAELKLNVTDRQTECALVVPECSAATPQEALEKMCAYLDRLKAGIKDRKEVQVPV